MSGFRLVRAADHRVMPWKNGGGETAEIAASPPGAALDAFDWRLSMATVAADGPFSAFPGIDRTLAILDGEGIRLTVDGHAPVVLTRASEPYPFAADAAASADLVGGAVVDLNLMSRRGRSVHRMERLALAAPAEIALSASETLLFCAEGAGDVDVAGRSLRIVGRDTLICPPEPSPLRFTPRPSALIYVMRIGYG